LAKGILTGSEFTEFKSDNLAYLRTFAVASDKVVEVDWESFRSWAIYGIDGRYKYDSAMHWNILRPYPESEFIKTAT
jgi:hypothetical protein